ncbi:hypothetical protein [Actinomycetospora lemnae]|uniref:Uncharacterized protein n=1 Tax=Actinomycetospora lemnae TaxID=3019891 RepID=A0ABT5SZZ4_9PSEU|nr:hypothetical protein [Actinomycetospora sp. DW7H6]MDD7968444.1 hypothetical protein [Actinomycetospora sp. DW7H6]
MSGPDRIRCAVAAAENGSQWWDLAARTQRARQGETIDHGDLYRLACEVVTTLRTLDDPVGVLARQTEAYGDGRPLRDDDGSDPATRLEWAVLSAGALRAELSSALDHANSYWSAIGHIGLDHLTHEPCEGGRP